MFSRFLILIARQEVPMTYKPHSNPTTPTILSVLFLLLAAVGYIVGSIVGRYAWLFQLVCIAGVVGAVYMILRWRMTWFVYAIRPREDSTPVWEGETPAFAGGIDLRYVPADRLDFIVVKGQGNRTGAMECVLGLDALLRAFPVVSKADGSGRQVYDRRTFLAQYPGAKLFEYTQSYGWTEAMIAVFRDGAGYAVLLLDLPEETEMGAWLRQIGRSRGGDANDEG